MNLWETLKNVSAGTRMKVTLIDKTVLEGTYDAYIKALDNDPEIASIDLRIGDSIYGLYETEIEKIELI